jgi:hypothetical protein
MMDTGLQRMAVDTAVAHPTLIREVTTVTHTTEIRITVMIVGMLRESVSDSKMSVSVLKKSVVASSVSDNDSRAHRPLQL